MKLAIFVQQLEYMGGIERVVVEHIHIFSQRGIECIVLLERPVEIFKDKITCPWLVLPIDEGARREALRVFFEKECIDVLILHGLSHQCVACDVEEAHRHGVKVVGVAHFSFPWAILINEDSDVWSIFRKTAVDCDAVVTVSRADAVWWRALGCNAYYVQNPFVKPPEAIGKRVVKTNGVKNCLWIGRITEAKQPEIVLKIFEKVFIRYPDTRLYMVGGDSVSQYCLQRCAKKMGISKHVVFVSEEKDISAYWKLADLHILTSLTESFCLVLAEAKAWHKPTVMFDLPFLELNESGRGVISVKKGDIQSFSDALVELLSDDEKRMFLGEEAYASLAPFNDDAVYNGWCSVFEALRLKSSLFPKASKDEIILASEMYDAWEYFRSKREWLLRMEDNFNRLTGGSLKGFAIFLEKIVSKARYLKRFLNRSKK